jgi:sensor c-di-GMP phosphodiesterase-like protein
VSPRRKLLMAIAIGVALTAPPVAALNIWLSSVVERRGQEELGLSARRTMALAETRIARVTAMLDDLAQRAIDTCRAADLQALQQATFATAPVKEFSIVAADGRTLCSENGAETEPRTIISSEPLTDDNRFLLDVVRLAAQPGQWVRIRRPAGSSGHAIAALVPAEMFFPHVSAHGAPLGFHIRLVTRAGSLIAEAGAAPAAGTGRQDLLAVAASSQRFGFKAIVSASASALDADHRDLRALGTIASGLLAVFILALAVLLPRRQRNNPVTEIERAVHAGEFVPYYQPIVDIRSGRLRGAEVLVRWCKADGSIVPPSAFIPLAESSGLIIELTRTLMRRVCREVGAAIGSRPHMKIGFNMSARHFADEEIVDDVRKIFKRSPLHMSQIVLEVTERDPIANLTETRRVVAALQGLGVRVAIDDVGSGHSGLSYMLKLGADIIKIDKMFVDSLGSDRNSNTIVETLLDLALNMRMDVVAEGVETFEQVVHLRELGIRAAQGYVFAPPLPAVSFLQLLEAIDPLKRGSEQGASLQAGAAAAPGSAAQVAAI